MTPSAGTTISSSSTARTRRSSGTTRPTRDASRRYSRNDSRVSSMTWSDRGIPSRFLRTSFPLAAAARITTMTTTVIPISIRTIPSPTSGTPETTTTTTTTGKPTNRRGNLCASSTTEQPCTIPQREKTSLGSSRPRNTPRGRPRPGGRRRRLRLLPAGAANRPDPPPLPFITASSPRTSTSATIPTRPGRSTPPSRSPTFEKTALRTRASGKGTKRTETNTAPPPSRKPHRRPCSTPGRSSRPPRGRSSRPTRGTSPACLPIASCLSRSTLTAPGANLKTKTPTPAITTAGGDGTGTTAPRPSCGAPSVPTGTRDGPPITALPFSRDPTWWSPSGSTPTTP
mmetsp:Transcript_15009/g.34347  ORF Transcript_15009/g.34347 Transcript_15009/m.34347 type:complete len:342 (-) Transcript_15009:677-1702(-)